ncbi:MAG: DUF2071 domain-containing protein [Ferruginibacter sp.]
MPDIPHILSDTSHRPFELPKGDWTYYQEWNNALLLHWKVPFEDLRKLVPQSLIIDTFNGDCFISLVAFTMQRIRPKYLPSVSFVSDFNEINLRTYVSNDNKPGVYFLNIEGGKTFSVLVAKLLSKLPYEKADIKRSDNLFTSKNIQKGFHFDTEFTIKDDLHSKTNLDKWLTERYCLYLNSSDQLYRYDIHHKEWKIKSVDIQKLKVAYKIGDIDLSVRLPDYTHYSEGVQVIAWRRRRL